MRLALGFKAINSVSPTPSVYVELAQAAERCGYESLWAPEIRTTDPFAFLAWLGGHTTNIGLGAGVAQVFARTPVATAASAITLAGLTGGRFRLGLGVAGPHIVEGWHGRPYQRPLSYLRDYLAVVRLALDGAPVQYAGPEITLPCPGASDGVVPLRFPTRPSRMPVYLAGLARNSVALAGELADGWMAVHTPPGYIKTAREWLQQGAARSGRSLDGFHTIVMLICSVDQDEDLARDLVRPTLALYLGGMGTRQRNFYVNLASRLGFATAATAVQEAFTGGDMGGAIAAVDDELVDAMSLCGRPERVREKLAAYREAGVDTVVISPAAPAPGGQLRQIELLATLAEYAQP
ncbi:MAG: LLM class flavin-dependent oxidoreductase [Streptosporangiaceae bacterium]|jgi:F420-dependent oxidoreductase-like protein